MSAKRLTCPFGVPCGAERRPSAVRRRHTYSTRPYKRGYKSCRRAAQAFAGLTVNELFVKPMKIAATVEASLEILQDHEAFAQWLPVELQRSVVNSESLYLFHPNAAGRPTTSEFNGLLATSGTLAQDATGLTFADALSLAYVKRAGRDVGHAALGISEWPSRRPRAGADDDYEVRCVDGRFHDVGASSEAPLTNKQHASRPAPKVG
jgi:hypothetical protein